MRFTEVKGLPKGARMYSATKNQHRLEDFMAQNIKIAKVDFESEYKSATSCCSSLYASVKRFGYPIAVHCVAGEVYLRRKDI